MSELCLMVSILDRTKAKKFRNLYSRYGVSVAFSTLGKGTAANEMLDYFGLEDSEKAVMFSTVTREVWKSVKKALQEEIRIDIPGTGIVFIIPMSSIGGRRQLSFLINGQEFEKGEETTLKDTKYELLIVVANRGYTDMIMDAARKGNSRGGTVIHAKGTGMAGAEKFLGVSIAEEKEMIFMVTKKEDKNSIMQAVMQDAGLNSKAQSIVFSLPVTSTAGMRLEELPPDLEES